MLLQDHWQLHPVLAANALRHRYLKCVIIKRSVSTPPTPKLDLQCKRDSCPQTLIPARNFSVLTTAKSKQLPTIKLAKRNPAFTGHVGITRNNTAAPSATAIIIMADCAHYHTRLNPSRPSCALAQRSSITLAVVACWDLS